VLVLHEKVENPVPSMRVHEKVENRVLNLARPMFNALAFAAAAVVY
jgi:hypothetical protein